MILVHMYVKGKLLAVISKCFEFLQRLTEFFAGSDKPSMLFFAAHKGLNASNCWHFNIFEQESFHAQLS